MYSMKSSLQAECDASKWLFWLAVIDHFQLAFRLLTKMRQSESFHIKMKVIHMEIKLSTQYERFYTSSCY